MAEIIIGNNNFTNYGSRVLSTTSTISNTGQATENGVCDEAKIYWKTNATGVYIGTAYSTGANKFIARDYASLGNMASGVQTVTGLAIDCETDDFASLYGSGTINRGTELYGWVALSNIFAGGEITFTYDTKQGYSFTLTGETVAAGGGALVGGSALVGGQILVGNSPLIN
jgi:hypothetical protein